MAAEGPRRYDSSALLGTLSAKIAAEVILGKIRFDHFQSEPPYLLPIRKIMLQFKKALGAEEFDKLVNDLRPALHALAAMLFDEVTGVHKTDTTERIKKLPVQHKVIVEAMVAELTGRSADRRERWDNDLYDLKRGVHQICTLSISDITPEEIRTGYDQFVHDVVDALYEQRKTLVS